MASVRKSGARGAGRAVAIVTAFAVVFSLPAAAQTSPSPPSGPARPAAGEPAQSADHAQDSQAFSRGELERLASPVALYPDRLLATVLMAATYPLEVVQAARWRKAHPGLKGARLEKALEDISWDPSVKALTAFPRVLAMLSDHLDWTEQLGEAFLAQQGGLMDAVQALRRRADAAGYLRSSSELAYQTLAYDGETEILIEPANPDVIYVPYYEPIVFGAWPYPEYPLYAWFVRRHHKGRHLWYAAGGAASGAALWAGWNWRQHRVEIDRGRFERFNRTAQAPQTWAHQPQHRRGAAYKIPGLEKQFGVVRRGPASAAEVPKPRTSRTATARDRMPAKTDRQRRLLQGEIRTDRSALRGGGLTAGPLLPPVYRDPRLKGRSPAAGLGATPSPEFTQVPRHPRATLRVPPTPHLNLPRGGVPRYAGPPPASVPRFHAPQATIPFNSPPPAIRTPSFIPAPHFSAPPAVLRAAPPPAMAVPHMAAPPPPAGIPGGFQGHRR